MKLKLKRNLIVLLLLATCTALSLILPLPALAQEGTVNPILLVEEQPTEEVIATPEVTAGNDVVVNVEAPPPASTDTDGLDFKSIVLGFLGGVAVTAASAGYLAKVIITSPLIVAALEKLASGLQPEALLQFRRGAQGLRETADLVDELTDGVDAGSKPRPPAL